jgi:hypothetical protein
MLVVLLSLLSPLPVAADALLFVLLLLCVCPCVLLSVFVLLPLLLTPDFDVALPPVAVELAPDVLVLDDELVGLEGSVGVVGGASHSNVRPLSTTTLPGASPVPVPLVPVGTCTRMLLPVQFHANDKPLHANIRITRAKILRIVYSPLNLLRIQPGRAEGGTGLSCQVR